MEDLIVLNVNIIIIFTFLGEIS